MKDRKNKAAVELGRKGGKARVARMTKEERSASARKAALARWAKKQERDGQFLVTVHEQVELEITKKSRRRQ